MQSEVVFHAGAVNRVSQAGQAVAQHLRRDGFVIKFDRDQIAAAVRLHRQHAIARAMKRLPEPFGVVADTERCNGKLCVVFGHVLTSGNSMRRCRNNDTA